MEQNSTTQAQALVGLKVGLLTPILDFWNEIQNDRDWAVDSHYLEYAGIVRVYDKTGGTSMHGEMAAKLSSVADVFGQSWGIYCDEAGIYATI